MKEIRVYLHRHHAADVVRALENAGFHDFRVMDVKEPLRAGDAYAQDCTLELGTRMVTRVRLELMCEDRHVLVATKLIARHARMDQSDTGWIYVSEISFAISINDHADDPG